MASCFDTGLIIVSLGKIVSILYVVEAGLGVMIVQTANFGHLVEQEIRCSL